MSAPTIRVPEKAYKDLLYGDLTLLQYFILVMFYRRSQFTDGTVQGMSADIIIDELDPLGLIPQNADRKNRRRFVQRAAKGIRDAGWYRWDYVEGSKRPYTIWLASFFKATSQNGNVASNDGSNVAEPVAESLATNPIEPTNNQTPLFETVADDVADGLSLTRVADMSPNTQCGQEMNERETPDQLQKTAVLYADFSRWLYDFSPDVNQVKTLLQEFEPVQLLFAQFERFPLQGDRIHKQTMAQFFFKSAKAQIEAARLTGKSKSKPEWFLADEKSKTAWLTCGKDKKEFSDRWKVVQDAWMGRKVCAAEVAE